MINFLVNEQLCNFCGLCAKDCVAGIILQKNKELPSIPTEREENCMECQHCLAVCPQGAISILEKIPENSIALNKDSFPTLTQMEHLIRGRRSIRHYKQENVDSKIIRKLLDTLAHVQTGANACALTFTVIDDINKMKSFQGQVLKELRSANIQNSIPERYRNMLNLNDEHLTSLLFRGAPHALIVSAPPNIPCPAEDAALAVATFELLAPTAGLGSVWWGFIRLISTFVPAVKSTLGIPQDHVISAALFGTPAIKFARTVQKEKAAQIKIF